MASPRPISGDAISANWGGEVHDVAVKSRFCEATGSVAVLNNGSAAVNAVAAGEASWLQGGKVVVPIAGLYRVEALFSVASGGGSSARIAVNKNGSGTNARCIVTPIGNNAHLQGAAFTVACDAGDAFDAGFTAQGPASGTITLTLSALRVQLVAYE